MNQGSLGDGGPQNREIRIILTTEGRGGGRANSQLPEEVLSGSSCVPPDSWHGGGAGRPPTSCAQLSPWLHSGSPAVSSPAAGLLNWRFVSAQGNNTGRGVRRKRGESKEAGVLQEDTGGCAWQDRQRSRNGGLYNRQPRKEKAEAWRGGLLGNQVWAEGPGGCQLW